MSRYIDADALIENIKNTADLGGWIGEALYQIKQVAIKYIDSAPTIEPKRGEWVKRTHNTLIAQVNFAYCSECGQPIMHEHTRPLWSFCPNCGAEMKGADDERQ